LGNNEFIKRNFDSLGESEFIKKRGFDNLGDHEFIKRYLDTLGQHEFIKKSLDSLGIYFLNSIFSKFSHGPIGNPRNSKVFNLMLYQYFNEVMG